MTILILAIGSYGDVLPLIGLGQRLRSQDYKVTLFTNDHFSDLVQQADLTFVPLGTQTDYDNLAQNPALWHPHKGWRIIMTKLASSHLRTAYNTLCAHVKTKSTLLLSSTLGFAARLVHETHHIPHVTVHFSPGVFHSAHSPPKMPNMSLPDWLPIWFKQGVWTCLDHLLIDPVVKPSLNHFRQELGLPPVSRIFHHWLHSPELVVGLFPDWFAPPQPDWPPRTVLTDFPLYDQTHDATTADKVEEFLGQHPNPLVFTPGSANMHAPGFFEEAKQACLALNRPAMFLTRYPQQIPKSLPPSIHHFSYVPLSRILPRCSALVHHGGIGTCAQALQAGIPQLIQPLAFDQFDNASRVERLGVGLTLQKKRFRAKPLHVALQHLLTSSDVQDACEATTKRFPRTDPLAKVADLIKNFHAPRSAL